MDEYPRMLYRLGGKEPIHGGMFSTTCVSNDADRDAAVANGWRLTTPDARQAYADVLAAADADREKEAEAAQAIADATKPPTRDELEQKARELGLKFDGRTSDRKLREQIESPAPANTSAEA